MDHNASSALLEFKSLSMDDLELSRQSGIWPTQAHNEGNLNHASQVSLKYTYSGVSINESPSLWLPIGDLKVQ